MSTAIRRVLLSILALICTAVLAQDSEPPAGTSPVGIPAMKQEQVGTEAAEVEVTTRRYGRHSRGNAVVSIGRDAMLAEGEHADAVVAVLGSVTSAGVVDDAVVSIMGNSRVTGPVGDSVVSIGGNLYINSRIDGDAVAVLGSMELGPQADIGGEVVVVGGTLERDALAQIAGGTQLVATGQISGFEGLRIWFRECVMYGRPLALAPGLGWAWWVALGFLALYVLMAFVFRGAVDRCAQTFETRPGRSVLAALLAMLLTPLMFVLLLVTVVGIALIPFLGFSLFCAGLFGKVVMLALIGRRIIGLFGNSPLAHTAMAVLLGGIIVLALYLVPILGFIVYKLLGILGLGVVVYTLILMARARGGNGGSDAVAPPPSASPSAGGGAQADNAAASAAAGAGSGPADTAADTTANTTAGTAAGPETTVAATAALASLPRAGFWVRMGALAIDVILVGIVFAFLPTLGGGWLLLLAIYGAAMWQLRGTTIGGIVFQLQVVRVDDRPVDWATAIVRALGCFLSLAAAGLGFLWIAFDGQRQAWHDKIAGTVVVRVPRSAGLL